MQNNEWKPAGKQRYEDSLKKDPFDSLGKPRSNWADLDGWVQRMWAAPEMNERLKEMQKNNF